MSRSLRAAVRPTSAATPGQAAVGHVPTPTKWTSRFASGYGKRTDPSASTNRRPMRHSTNPWVVLVLICFAQFMVLLGGALTQAFSWPWIFFINVPIGVATFLLSLRLVPESKDEAAHRSFDVAGAVTVTGGLMALVYAIVTAEQDGWTTARTIGTFVLSVGLLVAFVLIEQRAKAPLVRLSIFRVRSLATANLVMFLVASGLFAMFFFNTLYIQRVLGYGPLTAGLAFLPFTAGIMLSAGLASQFAPRVGVRIVAALGLAILSTVAATRTHGDSSAELVRGFHAAFAGSVLFVIAALATLMLLLR